MWLVELNRKKRYVRNLQVLRWSLREGHTAGALRDEDSWRMAWEFDLD
jgi:hypothetical protein